MLRWVLVKWAVLAVAIAFTAWLFPGIDVDGGVLTLLGIAAVFAVVNAVLGPIARLLTFPLLAITLGLFSLVINAVLFLLTDALLDDLDVDGFLAALGGSVVISVVVVTLELALRPLARARQRRLRTAAI